MNDEETSLSGIRFTGFLGWSGEDGPEEDDPAEAYHEAAKLTAASPQTPGAEAVQSDPSMAEDLLARSVQSNPHLALVSLPAPSYPDVRIGDAIARRQSRRHFGPAPLSLQDLSTLLHAAYGQTHRFDLPGMSDLAWRRSVPSAGGLYPLEIYAGVRNVEGLVPGLYHFDPVRQGLEAIREEDLDDPLREIIVRPPELPDVAGTCGVALFIVGVFWRTRFKYWLRGYRFTLLEAGHVAQNVLLVAEALGLSASPTGGYWDRKVDSFLGVDGVNESVVYSVLAGSSPGESDSSNFSAHPLMQ